MRKPKIGLLGLTLDLYRRNLPVLMPRLENFSRELKGTLSKTVETVHCPLAYDRRSVDAGFRLFEKERVDGIIMVLLSYSQSLETLPAASKTNIPLLIWNTQKLAEIDAAFGEKELLENHGMHGVQDLASVLLREGVDFSVITGHYRSGSVLSAVNGWCEAARAAAAISCARVGRIGSLFPKMGDFAMEPAVLKSALGPSVLEIKNSELQKFGRHAFSGKDVTARYLPANVSWSGEVDAGAKSDALRSVQFLADMVKEKNLAALAVNFEGMGKEMPMPFLGVSCLMQEGIGYGGEGDIYSATAVYLGQLLSDNRATFSEMFTTDYRNSRIFMSHMGESNIGLRRKGTVNLVLNRMELGNRVPSVVPVFSIKPGKYTLFNLTGVCGGGLKFIAGIVEVEDRKPLKAMNTPHFFIKTGRKVEDFLTKYSREGGTHHLAMAAGDVLGKLRFFCGIRKIPLAEI